MIRIRYSDGNTMEYKDVGLAKFMVLNVLFTSGGNIIPVEAIEVLGHTTGGVSVERDLKIKLGVIDFDW